MQQICKFREVARFLDLQGGGGLARPKTLFKDGGLPATGRRVQAFGWRPPVDVAWPGLPTEMHGKKEFVHM